MQSFAMASNAEFDSAIAEDALFNYGKLQYELGGGRFNEAIQVLNRYVAQYPSSPRVRTAKELLAAAYYNSHNYDEAYEIIASYPDPDGDLLAAKQKIAYFRGLSALERAIRRGPGVIWRSPPVSESVPNTMRWQPSGRVKSLTAGEITTLLCAITSPT